MGHRNALSRRRLGTQGARRILVLALLVLSGAGGWAPTAARPLHIQPALLAAVAAHPTARLQVIVQKQAAGTGVEATVGRLGGQVTLDLHIINGFAATLPAAAVAAVAGLDGVRWVSLDAPLAQSTAPCPGCPDGSNVQTAYIRAIHADQVWSEGPLYNEGQGIGVAVVDSGISDSDDLNATTDPHSPSRVVATVRFNPPPRDSHDRYGHGTLVAGVIAGNGTASNGANIGVAPRANLISVKVTDTNGATPTSNLVAGLQWILEHKSAYNIRVVNLSLNSNIAESYNTSPLDAALEVLWFNRVVVVVSAGNSGAGPLYPPANDPFVITVGATDDKGTPSLSDDTVATFSAYGTAAGQVKPDLVAPGVNIVSLLSSHSALALAHPDHGVDGNYFRMSGTSAAAPMVSGAAALLLASNPTLTPDQVKYRLKATAHPFGNPNQTGAGYLNVYAAVHGTTTANANTYLPVSTLLVFGGGSIHWPSVNWDSVNWDSVNWDSVNWDSVNWDSSAWTSDYWGP